MITLPKSSNPLLPALPAICKYSSVRKYLNPLFEYFFNFGNITVLVGIFTPTANVSVANNTFTNPFENRISITSFKIGTNPE